MISYTEPERRTGRLWQIIHFPLIRIILASLVLLIGVAGVQSLAIQPLRATASLGSPMALAWLVLYLAGSVLSLLIPGWIPNFSPAIDNVGNLLVVGCALSIVVFTRGRLSYTPGLALPPTDLPEPQA